MSQAYQNMCAGMYKVGHRHWILTPQLLSSYPAVTPNLCASPQTMVALDMDGKVQKPQFELDSEQVRYEHRFAPFNSVVTPPPVHYIQFKVLGWCWCTSSSRLSFSVPLTSNTFVLFFLLNTSFGPPPFGLNIRITLPFFPLDLLLIPFVGLALPSFSARSLWLFPSCVFQEMSDLKKYNPPPGSTDLYMAASKHFQQAKLILENVPSPDPEVSNTIKLLRGKPVCVIRFPTFLNIKVILKMYTWKYVLLEIHFGKTVSISL